MRYQLENYRKFLLNRASANQSIIDYIENVAGSEDESVKHTFHKIMVHNWSCNDEDLFDTLCEYFNITLIPVNYVSHSAMKTFYTCSLSFILRVIKLDFIFPYQRSMYNIDILFNDKTSADCFENRVTIDDIIAGIVSNRLSDKFELNLSNFSKDSELLQKNIFFYKLSLLSHFKILMLRMGRDARSLNLSFNNLSNIPYEILNFFIKGDLIEVNLSNNNLKSLSQLQRMSSKIEKLWLEGNPLCDEIEPCDYIKQISMRFPRLKELDGVKLNVDGILLPSYKNFIETPDRKMKMAAEKFLALYFENFDSFSRQNIDKFYNISSRLTFSTSSDDTFHQAMPHLAAYTTNLLSSNRRVGMPRKRAKPNTIDGRSKITEFLCLWPPTKHDPSSFTVDLFKHDGKAIILIVNGMCAMQHINSNAIPAFHFRRTFVFHTKPIGNANTLYLIQHELFTLCVPTEQQMEKMKLAVPKRNLTTLSLIDPSQEEIDSICNTFMRLTHLKRSPAELKLKDCNWDIRAALKVFVRDLTSERIPPENFEDEWSDLSSPYDEID